MNSMERSGISEPIQGFRVDVHASLTGAPYTYTPGPLDVAFRVGVQTDYCLNADTGTTVTLYPGETTVVNHNVTYTFDIALVLEIMR